MNSFQTASIAAKKALPPTLKTSLWLLKLMLPISLAVRLLQYWGIIDAIARWFSPLFHFLGLPGRAAIPFFTTALNTTYAGIAVMTSIPLTLREATILSVMMVLCHALPVESAVNRMTGSSFLKMCILRLTMAVIAAFYLNLVLPQMTASFSYAQNDAAISSIPILLKDWAANMTKMVALIFLIIYILMFIQQIIQIHHLMPRLSRSLRPLMKVFGLPEDAAYLWLVGNILGISYGGAVMMDMLEKKLITKEQANDVNYHLIMNHSLLEDTSIFAAIGISAFWIVSSRLIFALIVVWGRKLILHMRTLFLATCHHH